MDAWIVALVLVMKQTGKPIASLFVAEGHDEAAVKANVLALVLTQPEHIEMSSLPPEVAAAFNLQPNEVRSLR